MWFKLTTNHIKSQTLYPLRQTYFYRDITLNDDFEWGVYYCRVFHVCRGQNKYPVVIKLAPAAHQCVRKHFVIDRTFVNMLPKCVEQVDYTRLRAGIRHWVYNTSQFTTSLYTVIFLYDWRVNTNLIAYLPLFYYLLTVLYLYVQYETSTLRLSYVCGVSFTNIIYKYMLCVYCIM